MERNVSDESEMVKNNYLQDFQSSRFELPVDITCMSNMTPLDYLTHNVYISKAKASIYKKVRRHKISHKNVVKCKNLVILLL